MSRGKEKEGLPKVHMVVRGGEGRDVPCMALHQG